MAIFDVSDPDNINAKGIATDFLDGPNGVHVRDSYAYVIAENSNNLVVFNISDPDNITYVDQVSTILTNPKSLFASGDYVYVAYEGEEPSGENCGLAILDISDPTSLTVLNVIDMSEWWMWVDIGTVEEPEWVQRPPRPNAVTGNAERIYLANKRHNTVSIFEVDHLAAPVIKTGVLQAGNLEVIDNGIFNNDVNVRGGLNVGTGGVLIEGQLAVSGSDNNYILGPLSIGAVGKVFTDTAKTQILYPSHQLDVHGDARFRVNEYNNLMLFSDNEDARVDFIKDGQGTVITPSASIIFDVSDPFTHTTDIKFATQGADDSSWVARLTIGSNGNVHPAYDNAYSLGLDGNRWTSVYATNGTIQTSDGRLKEELMALPYGIEEISQLRPVVFSWADGPVDDVYYGLIAQEVKEVLPEMVRVGDDQQGTLGMNYSELVPVLIQAIQQQQVELEDQQVQIDGLEARLSVLESGNAARGPIGLPSAPLTWIGLFGLLAGGVVFLRRRS